MTESATTAERLLDAVVARIAATGAASVSIAGVRADAGVSVGAVYHHFPDRQALLDGAWLRALSSHQDALLEAVHGAPDARAGIEGGVAAYLTWHEQHRPEAIVLREPGPTRDRADGWQRRRALNRPFFAELAGWWARHAEAGSLRALPPVLVHALWLGAARDVCDLWMQGPADQPGPGEHAALLADAAWKTVSV